MGQPPVIRGRGQAQLVQCRRLVPDVLFVTAWSATIPEIDGTFIELETLAAEAGLAAALGDIRAVLGELGIAEDDLTTEQYTDAVMRART